MDMSRYILVRVAAIGAAILLAALALSVWRAQFDIKREEIGAAEVVRLFERLYALENGPEADLHANLDALRRINASGDLRHVQLELRDPLGRVLVEPDEKPLDGWLERTFAALAPGIRAQGSARSGPWTLQRDDGTRFVATLSLSPVSEQREALDNLTGMLGLLAGYGIAALFAVWWTLRRAMQPMQPILAAIARYERNDFDHRLPPLPFKEMDTVGRALNHLADSLARTQEARRLLSLKLVSSQEDERLRLARELHDEFGQTLTAIRADASWLARKSADDAQMQAVVGGIARHCERMHLDVRSLLARLRPHDPRDPDGAVPLRRLLTDLVDGWNGQPGGGVTFALDCEADALQLPGALALGLYRLTQEALTNVVRHAQATRATIALRRGPGGSVCWSVEDDGVGIDDVEAATRRGNGVAGLRERVWALGGEFEIGAAGARQGRPGLRLGATFPPQAVAAVDAPG